MKQFLAATNNPHKFRELSTVAAEFGVEMLAPQDLGLGPAPEVDETGVTYLENAALKARAYFDWAKIPAIADDSGLEVQALDNRPGVRSARYGGEGLSDRERIEKLLVELAELPEEKKQMKQACFRCCLVCCLPEQPILISESSLCGRILTKPQGSAGFGYDPIVYFEEFGATLAEFDFEQTCKLGFRGQALRQLLQILS